MKGKCIFAMVLLVILCATAFGGGRRDSTSAEERIDLVVFAAASMTETLERIAGLYGRIAPNVTLVFNFDSSGTLRTQIRENAYCDVFISAAQLQMDQIDISASPSVNSARSDFVLQGTRINLLENKVVLSVPPGNPARIGGFTDLANRIMNENILLAMGNSDVPVGQYTQRIFAYFNLDEAELVRRGRITYGSNVKEVTTQVREASVSSGIVYHTDAYSDGLEIVDYATAEMCGQVIYPAAVMRASGNIDAAKAFLAYLQSDEAMVVFERVGFSGMR